MRVETLVELQQHARRALKHEPGTDLDPRDKRAELLADAREQRLLVAINQAVFWGVLGAHLTLALIGGVAWALLIGRHLL